MKILANDGLHSSGRKMLEDAGIEVDTERVEQHDLPGALPAYDGIIVRSATKVRRELIENCPDLKVIGRAGVGLDNIDVDFAREKGIQVFNTPSASSRSVAELAIGHILSLARSLQESNREMPEKGHSAFKSLKKKYARGFELEGRSLGIIGAGRIGRELARIGLGMGMRVSFTDPYVEEVSIEMTFPPDQRISVKIPVVHQDALLAEADVISLHVPAIKGGPLIGKNEIGKMKEGVLLINCARGGVIDEKALLEALNNGTVGGAGLDVFENEPTPDPALLNHPKCSVTPHTGASTIDAQEKIGIEMARQIIDHFKDSIS